MNAAYTASFISEKDFENIVNQNKLIVYSTVLANLYAASEADDIVQETFIYAYYNFQTLRDISKLTGWLCGIARNKSRAFNKKHGRTVYIDDVQTEAETFEIAKIAEIAETFSVESAEETVMENYNRAEITKGILTLSEKLRETVTLYYIGEKSTREIAGILSIPEGTVRFRLAEARKKLKQELKELVNIMSNEKKEIADNELYAKVRENIDKAYDYLYKKHQAKKASDLCDETFTMINPDNINSINFINSVNSINSIEEKRLLYDLYHAKASSIYLIEPHEKHVEYLKKALELCEEIANEDFKWLAGEYYNYALRVNDKNYAEKAVEYAKKSGDIPLYAKCLFWFAACFDPATKLDEFKEILKYKEELFKEAYNADHYVLANGFRKILENVKFDENTTAYKTVGPGIAFENGKALLSGEQGISSSYNDNVKLINKPYVLDDVFINATNSDRIILSNDFREGYKFEGEETTYTYNNKKVISEVVSMSEEISVPAGKFTDCIHVTRTDILSDPDDDTSRSAELNKKFNSGIKNIWFAPNVGIVRIICEPTLGEKYSLELSEYKINNTNNTNETELIKKYLPIVLGNMWKYEAFDESHMPAADICTYENVFEVEYVSEKRNVISNWGYAYLKK